MKAKEKRAAEDELVGWHHRLNAHEFEQTPQDSERQGSLVCCSPRGHKEANTAKELNDCEVTGLGFIIYLIQKDAKNKVALALIVPLLPIEYIGLQ